MNDFAISAECAVHLSISRTSATTEHNFHNVLVDQCFRRIMTHSYIKRLACVRYRETVLTNEMTT